MPREKVVRFDVTNLIYQVLGRLVKARKISGQFTNTVIKFYFVPTELRMLSKCKPCFLPLPEPDQEPPAKRLQSCTSTSQEAFQWLWKSPEHTGYIRRKWGTLKGLLLCPLNH